MAELEHINMTIADAEATATVLCDVFGWHIRWQGSVRDGVGYSVHVGTDERYLALYSPNVPNGSAEGSAEHLRWLNHIGVVVPDLKKAEAKVAAAGLTPRSHFDYEPGERFYFDGPDGVEYEVVSYT